MTSAMSGRSCTGYGLVGGCDESLKPEAFVQRVQPHQGNGSGAIRICDDSAMFFDLVRVDLRYDQRHVCIHAKGGAIVDDHATLATGHLGKLKGVLRAGAENGNVQSLEGIGCCLLNDFKVSARLDFSSY